MKNLKHLSFKSVNKTVNFKNFILQIFEFLKADSYKNLTQMHFININE